MVKDASKVTIEAFKCLRCEHIWVPRDPTKPPIQCPRCRSPFWNRPRDSGEGSPVYKIARGK
jgi:DNA-directed RNA polymerase subunit RPC12/RpoP